jgi:hypothetical protein
MKYLKLFKLFESNNLRDIEDIFLELEDDGWNIKVYKPDYLNKPKSYLNSIQIEIKSDDKFKISDIAPELLRLKDYIGDSYQYLIKYEERKWLSDIVFIDDLSKIEYKEVYKVFISLYNTNDTYHVIWVNRDDPKVWDVLKPDFKTREEAIKYIEGTHISSNYVIKSFISDNEYWLKLEYLK